jgi:acetyl esterase/lipase
MTTIKCLVFTTVLIFSSAPLCDAQTPTFKTVLNVPFVFYDGTWLLMDIDIPVNQGTGPFPALISVHPGGWYTGGRDGAGGKREVLRGYVVARIDYRLSGTWKFPAAVQDVKAAVRFLRKRASLYRINPDKIGLWGQSAGGHLAALVGVSGGDPYLEGTHGTMGVDSRVQAVVDVTGPTDIMQLAGTYNCVGKANDAPDSFYSKYFTTGQSFTTLPNLVDRANPLRYVTADDPPIWIGHGTADCTVPFSQSQIFYDALVNAGLTAVFYPVDGAGHAFQPYLRPAATQSVEAFLDQYLKGSESASWETRPRSQSIKRSQRRKAS